MEPLWRSWDEDIAAMGTGGGHGGGVAGSGASGGAAVDMGDCPMAGLQTDGGQGNVLAAFPDLWASMNAWPGQSGMGGGDLGLDTR